MSNEVNNEEQTLLSEVKPFNNMYQLRWHDLNVLQDQYQILKDVSGTVKPGQHLVIAGPSGSGKTTLLNHLSGKFAHKRGMMDMISNTGKPEAQTSSGKIFINGQDVDMIMTEQRQHYFNYMRQDALILDEGKNVLDCLMKSYKSKSTLGNDQIEIICLQIMKELNLTSFKYKEIKTLPSGVRKMVAIAEALMGDAQIVFLDGVNDGLTDFQATAVFKLLQKMIKRDQPRTIISTTTHATSESYFYLDQLMLLVKGNVVYSNDVMKALKYFNSIRDNVPSRCNPFDYFMSELDIECFIERKKAEADANNDFETLSNEYDVFIEYLKAKYHESDLKIDPTIEHEGIMPLPPVEKDKDCTIF